MGELSVLKNYLYDRHQGGFAEVVSNLEQRLAEAEKVIEQVKEKLEFSCEHGDRCCFDGSCCETLEFLNKRLDFTKKEK